MSGPRRPVIEKGAAGSLGECGRWLTSLKRLDNEVLGFVHEERACDYQHGQTDKSMALALSRDDGLSWTAPQTIISGTDAPQRGTITGEGDCGLVDGHDGYLYAYCLRNADWQTIVARAPVSAPNAWSKYYNGAWDEPGIGGRATAIGFVGTGASYLKPGWIAAVATDPWFGGLRLSLSEDKVSFADLKDPLLPIDGADWNRPADTALMAYVSMLNPEDGSSDLDGRFLLSYVYVPPGKGFESRYLVQHEVSLALASEPQPVQVGLALERWVSDRGTYLTSTGPLIADGAVYAPDTIVAYMLTRPPDGADSVKIEECSGATSGRQEQVVDLDGRCETEGYVRTRTAGWLFMEAQPGTVPVYRCLTDAPRAEFASRSPDCEGLGTNPHLLGYGLSP
jgi:hypothetical protein